MLYILSSLNVKCLPPYFLVPNKGSDVVKSGVSDGLFCMYNIGHLVQFVPLPVLVFWFCIFGVLAPV